MIQGNSSSFRDLGITMLYWIAVVLLFLVIRIGHAEFLPHESLLLNGLYLMKNALMFGSILGLFLYILKSIVAHKNLDNVPYGKLILYRNLSYIFVFGTLASIGTLVSLYNVYGVASRNILRDTIFSPNTVIVVISFLLFAALFDLFSQVALKIGPNNFWRMITGRYHSPKEEEKIFMFLDLQSSTSIAEEIGHRRYSEFIQECFKDITIIGNFGGEVYQYVGDEAVFTWDARKKNSCLKSIEAFYAFQNKIQERREFYESKFGHVPLFKAGIHGGAVMVAEVGLLKKEIAFHGDTINTAARIQQLCNEKGKIFLASDYFEPILENAGKFSWEDMGDIILKGRNSLTKLYHPALLV